MGAPCAVVSARPSQRGWAWVRSRVGGLPCSSPAGPQQAAGPHAPADAAVWANHAVARPITTGARSNTLPWRLPAARPRRLPRSYALATDAEGLQLLMARSAAFACHAGRLDAIRSAEVGASAAMLAAGHGLDSLQLKCAEGKGDSGGTRGRAGVRAR